MSIRSFLKIVLSNTYLIGQPKILAI